MKVGERRERAEGGDDRETTVAMPRRLGRGEREQRVVTTARLQSPCHEGWGEERERAEGGDDRETTVAMP